MSRMLIDNVHGLFKLYDSICVEHLSDNLIIRLFFRI